MDLLTDAHRINPPATGEEMIFTTRRAALSLTTLLIISVAGAGTPYASRGTQDDEFILFSTDRDNPSELGICSGCEEVYVMRPDGAEATRLTSGGADLRSPEAPYNSAAPDWSDRQKLIAFQSNRINGVPQIFLMNLDGTEQRLLVSLPGGAAFPSFSPNGNHLCFHSQTRPRDIYTVNLNGHGLTNVTSPGRRPGEPGVSGDNIGATGRRRATSLRSAEPSLVVTRKSTWQTPTAQGTSCG